jgi:hypothetical protein
VAWQVRVNWNAIQLDETYLFPQTLLTGSVSWFSIMPIDVIKSRIQADISAKPLGFASVAKSLYKEFGFKGYFRGVYVVVVRGFIVNAVTLCVWSRCLRYFEGRRISPNLMKLDEAS